MSRQAALCEGEGGQVEASMIAARLQRVRGVGVDCIVRHASRHAMAGCMPPAQPAREPGCLQGGNTPRACVATEGSPPHLLAHPPVRLPRQRQRGG